MHQFKGICVIFVLFMLQVEAFNVTSSVSSKHQLAIGSNYTCYDIPVNNCVDLTNFEGTKNTRSIFMTSCETFLMNEWGDSCNSTFETDFYYLMMDYQDMLPFEHDIDVFGIYIYPYFYSQINYDLRNRNYKTHFVNETYYWLSLGMAAGMHKIDDLKGEYTSLVWRSETGSLYEYTVGHNYLCQFWMSTSYSREFAFEWNEGYDEVFLMISNSKGRDINHIITGEWEVLLAPGLNYHVMYMKNITNDYNYTIPQVFMYEIDNVTINYTAKQQKDLLAHMIKIDKIHAMNKTFFSSSTKKNIAIKQMGKNLYRNKAPSTWSCDRLHYDMNDGCDCNCGAWDPDCDKEGKISIVVNCDDGGSPTCDRSTSKCNYTEVPSKWSCLARHYDSKDGCHCGCGDYDPDCDGSSILTPILTECQLNREINNNRFKMGVAIGCDILGDCIYSEPAPKEWFCEDEWYGTDDGCDCNCGAIDPDCERERNPLVLNCPCETQTCVQGKCAGTCDSFGSIIIN